MLGIAAFVFMAGVIVGMQFFDVHRAGGSDEARPWSALVRSAMRPPRGGGAPGHGKLRRAEAVAAAEEEEDVAGAAEVEEAAASEAPPPVARAPGRAAERAGGRPGAVRRAGAARGAAGAAPVPAPAAAAEAPEPETWGDFSGRDGVDLLGPADALDVSLGAWVWLDPAARGGEGGMQTVASNRAGGCGGDAAHSGYALLVNTWDTRDRALVLEWRAPGGACGRLASEPGSVPMGRWVHLGFALQAPREGAPGAAMLFMDGVLLRRGPAARSEAEVQTAGRLRLGATTDGRFPLVGRIAQVFVSAHVVTPLQVRRAGREGGIAGRWGRQGEPL